MIEPPGRPVTFSVMTIVPERVPVANANSETIRLTVPVPVAVTPPSAVMFRNFMKVPGLGLKEAFQAQFCALVTVTVMF